MYFCQKLSYHRLHKSHEEWMWMCRTRCEFWMSLCGYHVGMIFQFDDLRQSPIRRSSRDDESCLLHLFTVGIIELESVTMAF